MKSEMEKVDSQRRLAKLSKKSLGLTDKINKLEERLSILENGNIEFGMDTITKITTGSGMSQPMGK